MNEHTVLVTGASGFIGGRIVERFALERTEPVRALIRSWSRAARPARLAVGVAVGDIMNRADVATVVRGVTHVVHCAYSSDPRVIIEGTRNLLNVALECGAKRFVFLSTAEVYGPHVNGVVDETTRVTPCGHAYADAKIAAERLCLEFSDRGLAVTILRPSIVYGPFGAAWTCGIAKRLQSGLWGQFQQYGNGYCNAVYVDDLVSAVFLVLERQAAVGQAFNVNGPDTVTWNEYFSRFNEVLGLAPLTMKSARSSASKARVVGPLVRLADAMMDRFGDRLMKIYLRGGAMSQLMRRVKSVLQATPSTHELNSLYSRRAIYTDEKARRQLNYEPQFDLDRGLALAALWLADGGFVDASATSELCTSTDAGQHVTSDCTQLEEAAAGSP